MSRTIDKDEARRLIDRMPDDATWDDLIREFYVMETVEQGLADSEADRVTPVAEIREKYGLAE